MFKGREAILVETIQKLLNQKNVRSKVLNLLSTNCIFLKYYPSGRRRKWAQPQSASQFVIDR